MGKKRKLSRKELEKKMTPEQLKKLKTHYGMGVSGEIGRADRWRPKKKRSNFGNLGRILEGPEGGRFTSSGRKKKQLPDEF